MALAPAAENRLLRKFENLRLSPHIGTCTYIQIEAHVDLFYKRNSVISSHLQQSAMFSRMYNTQQSYIRQSGTLKPRDEPLLHALAIFKCLFCLMALLKLTFVLALWGKRLHLNMSTYVQLHSTGIIN